MVEPPEIFHGIEGGQPRLCDHFRPGIVAHGFLEQHRALLAGLVPNQGQVPRRDALHLVAIIVEIACVQGMPEEPVDRRALRPHAAGGILPVRQRRVLGRNEGHVGIPVVRQPPYRRPLPQQVEHVPVAGEPVVKKQVIEIRVRAVRVAPVAAVAGGRPARPEVADRLALDDLRGQHPPGRRQAELVQEAPVSGQRERAGGVAEDVVVIRERAAVVITVPGCRVPELVAEDRVAEMAGPEAVGHEPVHAVAGDVGHRVGARRPQPGQAGLAARGRPPVPQFAQRAGPRHIGLPGPGHQRVIHVGRERGMERGRILAGRQESETHPGKRALPGSQPLVGRHHLQLQSGSIRNERLRLAEMHLLEARHDPAQRVGQRGHGMRGPEPVRDLPTQGQRVTRRRRHGRAQVLDKASGRRPLPEDAGLRAQERAGRAVGLDGQGQRNARESEIIVGRPCVVTHAARNIRRAIEMQVHVHRRRAGEEMVAQQIPETARGAGRRAEMAFRFDHDAERPLVLQRHGFRRSRGHGREAGHSNEARAGRMDHGAAPAPASIGEGHAPEQSEGLPRNLEKRRARIHHDRGRRGPRLNTCCQGRPARRPHVIGQRFPNRRGGGERDEQPLDRLGGEHAARPAGENFQLRRHGIAMSVANAQLAGIGPVKLAGNGQPVAHVRTRSRRAGVLGHEDRQRSLSDGGRCQEQAQSDSMEQAPAHGLTIPRRGTGE